MSDLPSSPAALRNRGPILELLAPALPAAGLVLEVASGTGEHVVHFAAALPALIFQPSDPDAGARAIIAARVAEAGLPNIRPPLALDAAAAHWPVEAADALLAINMAHISPWEATLGLLAGARRILPAGGPLALYGPWIVPGVQTAPSNLAFDADLKARNPEWGLRDLGVLEAEARAQGLSLQAVHTMPANNLLLLISRE